MPSDLMPCPRCGTPKSAVLAGNCPNCLIELGTSDAIAADHPPDRSPGVLCLGDYELIEEIARGGMGLVYRARQISLNRMVAVKVLLAGQFADKTFVQRFRREAEAAASLNHPHIVSIHHIGEHENRPYFSMELIEGRSLAEVVRDSPLPARHAAQLLQTIAAAVHFAHQRGVLHRDLKPSNVLVDAHGVPHITDFGLAKKVETTVASTAAGEQQQALPTELTLTGQVLGSPNYMPPEQANPKHGPATAASDVYSLGAILYHLLTGRPPYLADSVGQTLRLVVESDPVPPRLFNSALSRDLETICLKCLEKEPSRRYGSASELADELGRFLRDEPILATPIGPVGRLRRWCRRKPALAASLGAGAFLLLIIVIGSPIALLRIEAERKRAESARQKESALRMRAEDAEHETSRQLYTALLEQARATVRSGELGHRVRALAAIQRAAAISNTVELRREVFAALALGDLEFERQLPFPAGFTLRELDPTFERIAVCRGPRDVEILSVSDQKLLATLPGVTNRAVHVAEWSPNGRYLAVKRDFDSIGLHADLELWDVIKQQRLSIHRDVLWGTMCFHPQKPWWMIGGPGTDVTILDLETGREIRRFGLPGRIQTVQFSPKGDRFAAVHGDSNKFWNVSVFDATNGNRIAFRVFPVVAVSPVRWHPDGQWIVVPLGSGAVHSMDAATGELGDIGTHKAEATVAVFSPDGDYLLTSGWDREFNCFDGHTRRRLFSIRENSFVARFRADGGACALVTEAGVRLYKVARQYAHRDLPGELGTRLRYVSFSPNGQWLAASFQKRVAVWDLHSEGPPALDGSAYETHFFFSSDSTELFGSRNNARQSSGFRWRLHPSTNATARPVIERLPIPSPPDFSYVTIHSNQVVLTTERGSQVFSRDLLDADAVGDHWTKTVPGMTSVSPDGRWLAIRRAFSTGVYVYRLPDLERVAKLEHPTSIASIGFSPASDELTICSRAGLAFFSTASWQPTHIDTNLATQGFFYGADGRTLWLRRYHESGMYDRSTLQPKLLVTDEMTPWGVSADGKLLAVGIEGRRLQVWNLEELRGVYRELNIDWAESERPGSENVVELQDPLLVRSALGLALAQVERSGAAVLLKTKAPAGSARGILPEIQTIGDRPVVAMTEYKGWFWFATDVVRDSETKAIRNFISGYAVQRGGAEVVKWSVW